MKKNLPLDGLVVADFSRILAGPLCTQLLSDAGARVIKVEEREHGDETRRWGPPFAGDESAYFLSINRNKDSMTLNLKARESREIAKKLIERADVVIHNFRDRNAEEFGLTARAVRRINRRAVLCAIRGYERGTAEEDLAGYDLLAQAAAGLMTITGEPDGSPTKVGVALADVLTAHYAHGAILSALLGRASSGKGSFVEISLIGAAVASLVNVAQNYLVTGKEPKRYGNEHPSIVPYQAFATSDRSIVIAVATDRHFQLFCSRVLGSDELSRDVRFLTNAGRVAKRDVLVPILAEKLRARESDHWIRKCHAVGIPAAKVQTFSEIFSITAAPLVQTIGEMSFVGSPIVRDGRRTTIRNRPPRLGQHTTRVLKELGYSLEEIQLLRKKRVV